ncbi:MAG: ferrous iron transport protein B [Bacteroidetes bacterium]|nr:MAG: ferrous iron transport protein B [Bacteroidota bacterium]
MRLSDLKTGEDGVIVKVMGYGAFRKRIIEMGFIKGQKVKVIKNAPLRDPVEYNVMGYNVSLRKSEAKNVEVITKEEAKGLKLNNYEGVIDEDVLKTSAREKRKNIHIALVGNPNSGKTTLFNYASGSKEHVGNYSGVTIEAKNAKFKQNGYKFDIADLPGTYSLAAYSPEELYVRKYIFSEKPDIVVNIVDASNLERNLYLTTQLIDMDIKVVVALNMYDELKNKGANFNYKALGEMIGVPIVPTVSSKGTGVKELFDEIIEVYEDREPIVRHIHINYGKEVEKSIKIIRDKIGEVKQIKDKASTRFLAIKLLEKDRSTNFILSRFDIYEEIKEVTENEIKRLESSLLDDCETIITDAKYGFITGALKETYVEGVKKRRKKTDIIDTIVLHKVFGFPIFLFFMGLMFYTTFGLGKYPMDWISQLVDLICVGVRRVLPNGILKDLLVDGIIGGVGGVIVFLPNILILFLFISFMEDTGYMARAAFIMDKLMHKIGLHGKSFIPLVMGFGCNVPAIMATRTIENRNDRLLTMLINPFMSCSARLPVYILIIGAFFPKYPGLMLLGIYLFGIFLAVVIAKIFKRYLFKSKKAPFVMELPPYRMPTARTIFLHMWNKGAQYLKKMGNVILFASIIIWALGYFPRDVNYSKDYASLISQKENFNKINVESTDLNSSKQHIEFDNNEIEELKAEREKEHKENSYLGTMGRFIEPVIKPLGFDWRMGVSLIAGVAAKEIVVSTMGVVYQADTEEGETLQQKIKQQVYTDGSKKGQKIFTPLTALCFLLFILIYFPCVATIAAIKKESGSWKWAFFTVLYTTSLAWIVSFIVYQIGSVFV